MSKPYQLEMQFPSSNTCVQKFNDCCCSWGQKKTTYDTEGKIKGCTSPLWQNPSKKFYKIFFGLTLLCSLLFVGSYVAIQFYDSNLSNSVARPKTTDTTVSAEDYANNKTCVNESHQYLKSWFIIIGSAILFINSLYCLFLGCVDYASDKEWSRYLSINTLCWCALIGFVIADYLTFIDNLNYFNTAVIFTKSGTDSCQLFFKAVLWVNLVVAVLISILAVLLIVKVFIIAKNFFLVKYVPHTALSEDEDIIVME